LKESDHFGTEVAHLYADGAERVQHQTTFK